MLDESIIAQDKDNNGTNDPAIENLAASSPAFYIKSWKQIDLSKLDIEKLREEYEKAPHKNIEIADLRAFIAGKLQQMLNQNSTRSSFAQKLQIIIDRYNAGSSTNEGFFDELMEFLEQMCEEEMRAAREGMSEAELELFDLLKKMALPKTRNRK